MERVDDLNARLVDYYGVDTATGRPLFRIVWADEQTEKRLVDHLDSGVHLLRPEVREVKKYPYLKHLYVLERLVIVPDTSMKELPVAKQSYEPVWAYRDAHDNPLPPVWEPTKFVVDALYAALGKSSLRKYVESESELNQEARVERLHQELFGNETEVTDALAYKEGVVVPRNYTKEK